LDAAQKALSAREASLNALAEKVSDVEETLQALEAREAAIARRQEIQDGYDAELEGWQSRLEAAQKELAEARDTLAAEQEALEAREEELAVLEESQTTRKTHLLSALGEAMAVIDTDGTITAERTPIFDRLLGVSGDAQIDAVLNTIEPKLGDQFAIGWEALRIGFVSPVEALKELPRRLRLDGSSYSVSYTPLVEGERLLGVVMRLREHTQSLPRIEMSGAELTRLVGLVKARVPYAFLAARLEELSFEAMETRLGAIARSAKRLAAEHDRVVTVTVEPGEVRLSSEEWGPFWSSFTSMVAELSLREPVLTLRAEYAMPGDVPGEGVDASVGRLCMIEVETGSGASIQATEAVEAAVSAMGGAVTAAAGRLSCWAPAPVFAAQATPAKVAESA
ncbi:MAG: hypothetical protein AAFV53_13835, partial [Myxococcota bacterium]